MHCSSMGQTQGLHPLLTLSFIKTDYSVVFENVCYERVRLELVVFKFFKEIERETPQFEIPIIKKCSSREIKRVENKEILTRDRNMVFAF